MKDMVYVENGITGDYEINITPNISIPDNYYEVTNLVRTFPFFLRITYWTLLYFYNRHKWPNGSFTLKLYHTYTTNPRENKTITR